MVTQLAKWCLEKTLKPRMTKLLNKQSKVIGQLNQLQAQHRMLQREIEDVDKQMKKCKEDIEVGEEEILYTAT